ncbi:MAG: hypothetical protein EAZ34_00285 [Polaromonas sp.]|nr:MAG: hypothetical protein EAZ34_00285 [Polaromonas sp.]
MTPPMQLKTEPPAKIKLPQFDKRGLLPPGAYGCTLAQARAIFAYNIRRELLFNALTRALQLMRQANLAGDVLLDGSFVTDKAHPDGLDVILDARHQSQNAQAQALLFYISRTQELAKMGVNWFVNLKGDNSTSHHNFNDFFHYVGARTAATKQLQPQDKKGTLRLVAW